MRLALLILLQKKESLLLEWTSPKILASMIFKKHFQSTFLSRFADRRTDIFGVGEEGAKQTIIGKKLGEADAPSKPTKDGVCRQLLVEIIAIFRFGMELLKPWSLLHGKLKRKFVFIQYNQY